LVAGVIIAQIGRFERKKVKEVKVHKKEKTKLYK
jgi:hypothetical protein